MEARTNPRNAKPKTGTNASNVAGQKISALEFDEAKETLDSKQTKLSFPY